MVQTTRLITPAEVSEILRVSEKTLETWRYNRRRGQRPDGPPYVRLSSNTVLYKHREVMEWIDTREVSS